MHPALQARTRIVQSSTNRRVKALRAALAHPPALSPQSDGVSGAEPIALEGFHLLVEALRSGLAPLTIFLRAGDEDATLRTLDAALKPLRAVVPEATEWLVLPPALFESLMRTEAPQPVAALLPQPGHTAGRVLAVDPALVLVLCGLQDPGNLGTLLRSAEAFGATCALLLAGTATPWSGKSLRASAGSALRLPLLAARDAGEASTLLRAHGIRSYAAMPSGGELPSHAPLGQPSALWLGNEGAGLSAAHLAACEARLTLPMPGATESLNAAVAGSLLLYEASRLRASVRPASEPA